MTLTQEMSATSSLHLQVFKRLSELNHSSGIEQDQLNALIKDTSERMQILNDLMQKMWQEKRNYS